MGLPKGKTNNKNGRPAGSPNKITIDLRERIQALIGKNFNKIESDFDELDPEKRLIVLEKYLKYCLPPLQRLDISGLPGIPLPPPPPRIIIVADQETKDLINELDRQAEENQ